MTRRLMFICMMICPLWIAAAGGFTSGAGATVQDDNECWDPDVEFPVPCDEDED